MRMRMQIRDWIPKWNPMPKHKATCDFQPPCAHGPALLAAHARWVAGLAQHWLEGSAVSNRPLADGGLNHGCHLQDAHDGAGGGCSCEILQQLAQALAGVAQAAFGSFKTHPAGGGDFINRQIAFNLQ